MRLSIAANVLQQSQTDCQPRQVCNRQLFPAFLAVLTLLILIIPSPASGQTPIPKVSIGIDQAKTPADVAVTIQILVLLTILTLAPSILVLMTSFTRIVVVLHFLRQAVGVQQIPPNPVVIGLALFLTLFVMQAPVQQIYDRAWTPYKDGQISIQQAFAESQQPLKEFMLRQTREKDLALFVRLSAQPQPENAAQLPLSIVVPGFVISELRTGFQIGFLIYLPFLVIDMVVASVLMSMGMLMLPPAMISLPFKVLLFVLADGWYLVVESMIKGFK
ncbi:MAG: flagellar type III secretion system pore protein FliP [Calditrichaeota bacterium]|nr:flagellar type III secretion system pore protein FliP [Calditrichota bacterium]